MSTRTTTNAFISSSPLRLSSTSSCNSLLPSGGLQSICATPLPRSPQHVKGNRRATVTTTTMGIFGLGFPELLVIAGVGILVFGPSKITELGKDLGGIAGGVKKASAEFKEAMQDSLEEADMEIEQRRMEKDTTIPISTTIVNATPVSQSATETPMPTTTTTTSPAEPTTSPTATTTSTTAPIENKEPKES